MRVFESAGEAMKDATEPGWFPDFFEKIEGVRPGIAAMNDDGKLCGVGQSHLFAEDFLLDLARRMVVEVVKADFAPGDYFWAMRKSFQCGEMFGSDLLGFMRMDADAAVDPVVGFGVGQSGVEFFRAWTGADGQDGFHAGGLRALQHGFAVVCELREIDMGVRVDEFHGIRM